MRTKGRGRVKGSRRVGFMFIAVTLTFLLHFSVCLADGSFNGNKVERRDKTQFVADLLKQFAVDVAAPSIHMFRERQHLLQNKEPCFSTHAGIHLGYRCCVYYTNIFGALLQQRFAPRISKALARAHSAPIPASIFEPRWRKWATISSVSSGVYNADISIDGEVFKLQKCEFGDVHTYLVLSGSSTEDIIIDPSFKQLLLVPDIMDEKGYKRARDMRMYSSFKDIFVGTEREFKRYFGIDQIVDDMKSIYGANAFHGSASVTMSDVKKYNALRKQLYEKTFRQNVCGKQTQLLGDG